MSEKSHSKKQAERKVDLRNVFLDEDTDTGIQEYVLRQKKNKRHVKKGEAAVELIKKGLNAEGIE
jgi:hypothetical protein